MTCPEWFVKDFGSVDPRKLQRKVEENEELCKTLELLKHHTLNRYIQRCDRDKLSTITKGEPILNIAVFPLMAQIANKLIEGNNADAQELIKILRTILMVPETP